MPKAPSSASAIPTSAPVAVLAGPDRFLHLEHTRSLLDALKAAHDEVDLLTFDGERAQPADVLDECRSLGLMVRRKLVIVDAADLFLRASDDEAPRGRKSARELFEAYCAQPEPATTLLLRAAQWRPGKIDALIAKAGGAIVRCDPPANADAARWVAARAQSHHHAKIQPAAATALINAIGVDLARLDSELGKLAITLAARAPAPGAPKGETPAVIDEALVAEMVGQSREEEIWAFQQGVLSGDPANALRELHRALDVSRHDPVAINVAYLFLLQALDGIARGLAAGEPYAKVMSRFWKRDALVPTAQRLGPGRTGDLLRRAVETDAKLKSGRGDPVHLIEVLTIELATALAGATLARQG